MICYFFPETVYFFFSSDVPPLLYYAHIPVMIVSLLAGLYVLKSGVSNLLNRLFFVISFFFSLWTTINLITWTNIHSDIIMFFWSFFSISLSLIAISCIYFIYVFLEKKDISNRIKAIFILLLTPTFLFSATPLNINGFDIANCDAFKFEWLPFKVYYTLLGILAIIWILILLIRKYRVATLELRKQIVLMGLGIELFLSTFFIFIFLASYLTQIGLLADSRLEWYGLLGMVIFMVYISILIVRFKAFNVKLLGAQVLVVGLVIIIGSELFFAENTTNQILILVSLAIATVFGYMLIKSIKMEVQRKEELQEMSNRLSTANDQLRKLDNAKSEFISIASHQLRTPLTAIKGFISLILEGSYGNISGEIEGVLNKVYLSNERLIDLVEDLLNLSRIESGRMEYKFEKTNLGEVCQEIYDTFLLRAKEKNLNLELILAENSNMEAMVDRNKIREVISNLVDNGLKYTLKGGVKIKLTDMGESMRVAIIDTGIGVPAEEIPYLFSKFSRGKDISRLNTGGTGLGLHVGKKMIEAIGGKIGVASEGANRGSTFLIEVPKEHVE